MYLFQHIRIFQKLHAETVALGSANGERQGGEACRPGITARL